MKKFAIVFLAATSLASSAAQANDRRLTNLLQNFGATELHQTAATRLQRTEPADRSTRWKGAAVSRDGRGPFTLLRNDESEARRDAKFVCEQASGRSCRAIAVPHWWDLGKAECAGDAFIGGSGKGEEESVALDKAAAAGFAPGNCTVRRYESSSTVAEAR